MYGVESMKRNAVAPFAGAWIEILIESGFLPEAKVAPFAGAWIEIRAIWNMMLADKVAPFAGAWIEITKP